MPKLGDLVLFRASSKDSAANRLAQSVARLQKSEVTHVALTYGSHTFVDARPGVGIWMHPIDDELSGQSAGAYTVIRNRALDIDNTLQRKLQTFVELSVGGNYNWLFLLMQRDSNAFCSEFVARAYEYLGLGIASKSPVQVLPSELQDLKRRSDWTDVTAEYAAYVTPESYSEYSDAERDRLTKRDFEIRKSAATHERESLQLLSNPVKCMLREEQRVTGRKRER